MKRRMFFVYGVLLVWLLTSCATQTSVPPATTTPISPAATIQPTPGTVPLEDVREPGPYYVGVREFSAEDGSRAERKVGVRVWYPALLPEGSAGTKLQVGAKREPDRSGAPYPLVISSAKTGAQLAPYLVTHGFVWAGVTRIDTYDVYNTQMIDQPLDILFALDQVAAHPPIELEGMIDAERTGATGYSFDGYNTLVLGGARINPAFYLAQCAQADATAEAVLTILGNRYQCALAGQWAAFAAHAGPAITTSPDGLWQPMTDERIRAIMPLAGEGWLLFGDQGLAAVDRPALILVSTEDIWYHENALIFERLSSPEKALIAFVGESHMMVYNRDMVARMAHFAVAFFGYHLQGREDLAYYFSEEFVAQYDDLAWGIHEGR